MKHALLAALAILYWMVVGHGHTWAFAAIALAAIRNDWRRSLECSGSWNPSRARAFNAPSGITAGSVARTSFTALGVGGVPCVGSSGS